MATKKTTKKTTAKKTTTKKKTVKKEEKQVSVEEMFLNEAQNTALTSEDIEQVNEERKNNAVVEEETIEVVAALEPSVDEIPETEKEAYEEKVEQITEEVNQKVADNLEDFSVEEIQQEEEEKEMKIVENKDKTQPKKKLTVDNVFGHTWMGQIIDF